VLPAPEKTSYQNNQISAMHLCFEVDDIDAAMERLKEIGINRKVNLLYFRKKMD
jgi:hypothetical protein